MAKIFVSSTYLDLKEHREQVERVIRRMGHEDVAMEYYVAEDQRPVAKCLADVASCDVYIGIFSWRYGWQPKDDNPENYSITEMEFRQSEKSGKPCLIFLLSDDAPWLKKHIDKDTTRIEALRSTASAHHTADHFSNPDDLARKVAEAIHKWEKDKGHASTGLLFSFDIGKYFGALRKRYGVLALEGLTPPQKEEYLQIQLRSVFVEQNVRENPPPIELPKEVWEKLQHDKEIHPEDLPEGITLDEVRKARAAYYEKPSRLVLDVLADAHYHRTIILGDPGSGKSTLARYVMLSVIDPDGSAKLRNAFDGYMPLIIELRTYAGLCAEGRCDSFLEFLEYLGKTEGWGLTQAALHNYLKGDGRAVVIFDGLDEIFDAEQREQISRQIVGFAGDYPKSYTIVTSRIIGYRRKILTDAGFTHFTLQDLDEKQVELFVTRWYDLAMNEHPAEAKERRERILRSFEDSASIRQLAGNPMLLTIMAIIGKHQELPRGRWKLYDHASSVLIQHWDVNKHLKDESIQADFIGEDDKKELLRRLAFRMQSGEGGLAGNYIHRDDLQAGFESYLKERYAQPPDRAVTIARAMIDQFRERNFILSLYGANLYGFVHRAFLEYFCASAFVWKFEKTKELTIEDLNRDVYGEHWEDQSWHEVLRLICGMIDEKWAGEVIDYLSNETYHPWPEFFAGHPPRNIELAIYCLGEVRNPNTLRELPENLLKLICKLFNHAFDEGSESLSFVEYIEQQFVLPIKLVGTSWPQRDVLVGWLRGLSTAKYAFFFARAFGNFVGFVGARQESIHEVLLDYHNRNDSNFRLLSLWGLSIGWPMEKWTLSCLHDSIVNDVDSTVRKVGLSALIQCFRDDPQTLLLVRDRVVNDAHQEVRSAAVRALAEHFRKDAQTLLLVRDRVVNDTHHEVRSAAVRALTEHFRKDAQTLPLLRDCAMNDARENVRSEAVRDLGLYFSGDVRTLPLMRNRAIEDPNEGVRRASIEQIAYCFHDDAQSLRLLHDRAINDVSPKSDGLVIIINDEMLNVRGVAINMVAKLWPRHPDTLSLLRDRAVNDPTPSLREYAKTLADEIEGKAKQE